MKKLLSVLLTLVMAVCLVNLNNNRTKADEATPITTPVYYNGGKFYSDSSYQSEITKTALDNAGISYDATKDVVILDGTNANHGIKIGTEATPSTETRALDLNGATKVEVKGDFKIDLITSGAGTIALNVRGADVVFYGDENSSTTLNVNLNNKSNGQAFGCSANNDITIKNLKFNVNTDRAAEKNTYAMCYVRKVILDDNSIITLNSPSGYYSGAFDTSSLDYRIYGAEILEGSTKAADPPEITANLVFQNWYGDCAYRIETSPGTFSMATYLKASNLSKYTFTYDEVGAVWVPSVMLPLNASKDDNIEIKNTGSDDVTVNFVDGTTKTIEAGETYTYKVKYNVKITDSDLDDSARTIKVYDGVESKGIMYSANGQWWEYNGTSYAQVNDNRLSELGITYSENTNTPTMTLSKNIIGTAIDDTYKSTLAIGKELNIELANDVTITNTENGSCLNTVANIEIDGESNKLNLITDNNSALVWEAKVTLKDIDVVAKNNSTNATLKGKNSVLSLEGNSKLEAYQADSALGSDATRFGDANADIIHNGENVGTNTSQGITTETQLMKRGPIAPDNYYYYGFNSAAAAKYVRFTNVAPSPSPTPSPSDPKDESCEKVIGPTWHWNNDKGICEDYGVVGTSTR